MSYLSEFHPEVFLALPRHGGVVKILPPDELAAAAPLLKLGGKGSRTTLKSARSAKSTATTKSTGTTKSLFDTPQFTSTPGQACREFRIRTVASSSPWILFDDEEDAESPLPPNPIFDTMTILAITISTIMLMAAEYADISKDHLKWSLSYLECVKDEFGSYPPNVRGIMNNIRLIDDNLASFNEGGQTDNLEDKNADDADAA